MEALNLLAIRRNIELALERIDGVTLHGAGMFLDGTSADISFSYKEEPVKLTIEPRK